jgi:hypothetical protein
MLHLLTEDEFRHERTMGKMWREGREPFWKREPQAYLMSSRYSYAVNLPVLKSLVNENQSINNSRVLGDWGWTSMKGICPVCDKPVYDSYPWWTGTARNRGLPLHDDCADKYFYTKYPNIHDIT